MDYTNCVFASEGNARTEVKRDELIRRFGLEGKVEAGKPILSYIIEVNLVVMQKFKGGIPSTASVPATKDVKLETKDLKPQAKKQKSD
jgi:hypothetical protein